ncbi:RDD family protein [Salibacterium aidingense]|uniref:RDD family protein n=1 Tax=Salibacterium aidingense TaxID=384933 RepID=UPI0003F5C35D|nr:RDD family protein [Salibacterium aidingense]
MNASFYLRVKAFLFDYLLMAAYGAVLFFLSTVLFPSIQQWFSGGAATAQTVGFLLVTLPVSLYFIVSDSVIGGQSFGKRKTGIQVVDHQYHALSVPRAVVRTVLKFLPWELSHSMVYRMVDSGGGDVPWELYLQVALVYFFIFTYVLLAVFTKKKQSLYDKLTGTQVIKIPRQS